MLVEPDAFADEHRGDVHDDLVEKARLETLTRDVRAEDDDVAPVGRFSGNRHRLLDVNVKEAAADPLYNGRLGRRVVP